MQTGFHYNGTGEDLRSVCLKEQKRSDKED